MNTNEPGYLGILASALRSRTYAHSVTAAADSWECVEAAFAWGGGC